MYKPLAIVLVTAAAAAAFSASTARAGGVSWSVAIDTPGIVTVISNAQPGYAPGYDARGYDAPGYDAPDHRAPAYRTPARAPGYAYRGAPVPAYVSAAPAVVSAPVYLRSEPIYVRSEPAYLAIPEPAYDSREWRHPRRVIVVPSRPWHHRGAWHRDDHRGWHRDWHRD